MVMGRDKPGDDQKLGACLRPYAACAVKFIDLNARA
jgi:hypothetical protein